MPRLSTAPLNTEESQKLLALIAEAKSRGIELPKEAVQSLNRKKITWPIAPNGYFIRNDGRLYEPSESQAAFIASKARFGLFYGSRGSGKSASGAQKALMKIRDGKRGAVMNPDFENFKYSTWPEFKAWIPWNMVIPSQRHRASDAWEPHQPFSLVFLNGAVVYCKGLKDPDSARGPNINWLWYDEGGRDDTGLGWKIALASVRFGDDPQAWTTETPRPTEHWSYQFFVKKEIPKEALEEFAKVQKPGTILVESFHGTIEQNKSHLDPAFYAALLAAYPSGWLKSQEVDGEFADEGGKIGDRHWFDGHILDHAPEKIIRRVRFYDLAATEKKQAKDDPDETVGSLVSKFINSETKSTDFCIEHQVSGYWDWDKLLEAIVNTARFDGPYVPIVLEEEPGSGGKNQVAAIKNHLKKFPELASIKVIGQRAREVGDRVMGANHWFSIAAEGRMWLVKGAWNEKFLGQVDGFTQITHDDHVTSVTGAIYYVNPFKSWAKVPFLTV